MSINKSKMTEATMKNQEILNALNEKIKAAEEALLYLNQTKAGLEKVIANSTKTPVEEAYKKVYGKYPVTDIADTCWDGDGWNDFQAGYNAACEEPKENEWKNVALEFGKNLPAILPHSYNELSPIAWYRWVVFTYNKYMEQRDIECGYTPKSQEEVNTLQEKEWTYKITNEEGETNPYKQYLNSVKNLQENNWYVDAKSLVKPQTLYSLIGEFLNEIDYMYNTDSEREYFLEKFKEWLPKPIEETCGMNEKDADWNRGYNTYREYLMMQLK